MLQKEILTFLKNLKKNNNRDWFKDQKKHYDTNVKEPFTEFVTQLISKVSKFDPLIDMPAKKAIFRIYRDVRFSKDKSPYKTHLSAAFAPNGRKNPNDPGYYFHLEADRIMLGGGSYFMDKKGLQTLREFIDNDVKRFNKIINKKSFINHYHSVQGEANKRIPKEFQDTFEIQPLIANKQFYFMSELPSKVIVEKDFMKKCIQIYKAGFEFNDYMREAFSHIE